MSRRPLALNRRGARALLPLSLLVGFAASAPVFLVQGIAPLIFEDLEAIGIRVNVTRHAAVEARKPLQHPGHNSIFCGNWYADFPDSDNFFYVFFHSQASSLASR